MNFQTKNIHFTSQYQICKQIVLKLLTASQDPQLDSNPFIPLLSVTDRYRSYKTRPNLYLTLVFNFNDDRKTIQLFQYYKTS
jgi:hypothetical protein